MGEAMNWDALGATGELISAFAVVVSLVYLANQIKSSTHDFKASMRDSAFRSLEAWSHTIISDPELAWVFQRGCRDFESLDAKEKAR